MPLFILDIYFEKCHGVILYVILCYDRDVMSGLEYIKKLRSFDSRKKMYP